jgi:hypothetical protein
MRTAKMIQTEGKVIYLECPKHGIPYTMEASGDPIHEGTWKHFYCEKCRQERGVKSED